MSDNVAILNGYTREVIASGIEHDLYLLVKPEADLSGTFKAWDMDNQEFIRVNGWLYSIEQTDWSVGKVGDGKPGTHFPTLEAAEAEIERIRQTVDREGVEAGEYYIDGPTE